MKKVIIGMLLLLPLIIVASVLFAIDIIAVEAYIAVERVELNHTSLTLNLSDAYYDGLEATVYPTRVKEAHKTVVWRIEDEQKTVAYDGAIADIDPATGKLTLHSYGTFTVVATTVMGNKSALCRVYIQGDKVESITLTAAKETLTTGESLKLDAVFYPVDAVVKEAVWESGAPNILSVDQNGIVTALRTSTAPVAVTVTANNVVGTILLAVTKGTTYYGQTLYISDASVTLISLGVNPGDFSSVTGGSHANGTLTFSASEMTVTLVNGDTFTVARCAANAYEIENAALLAGTTVRVGKLPLQLAVRPKDSRRSAVPADAWVSSDPAVATVSQNGLVTPLKKGDVVFTAYIGGTAVDSIAISIIKPVSLIVLNKSETAEQKGILGKTYYGTAAYDELGTLIPYSFLVEAVFPDDIEPEEDLRFSVDRDDLATVNAAGLVTLNKNYTGGPQVVTLTVSAVEVPYPSVSVSKTYKFTVVGGVSVSTHADALRAANASLPVCLLADIAFAKGDAPFHLTNHFYGNGHILDAIALEDKATDYYMLRVTGSNVTISNLNVKCDTPERIADANGLRGYALYIEPESGFIENVRVEYSILENGYYCATVRNAAVTFEGSILRNASNFGLHAPMYYSRHESSRSDIVIKNNVFSNIVAPAVGVTADSELPEDFVPSTFKVEGFADMYNWQQIDSMRMLDRDFIADNPAMNSIIKTVINNFLVAEFKKSDYDALRYFEGGVHYFHMGIITAGGLYYCPTEPDITGDPRLMKFDIAVLHNGSIPLITLEPCILYLYPNTADIKPGDVPEENETLYKKLRGETDTL